MAAGKKKTILNPPAPKANSLTGPKTKPASNSLNRVPVVRKQQHAGTSGKKEERGVEKSTGGEKNQRTGNEGEKKTKEFSTIRSKTWEKEEFEASKNVGKRKKENDEDGRKMEGRKEKENDGKSKAETKGGGWKDKRSDESMKNEKITVSDQKERNRMERKEDKKMEYLNKRNEEEEEIEEEIGMNNREQIEPAEDADLQDNYSDDFEDYDSDFEEDDEEEGEGEDEESFAGVTGNENARNSPGKKDGMEENARNSPGKKDGMEEEEAENIDGRKDELSVAGYERKNVFSRDERDWKEVLGMKEEDMRSEKKVRIEEVRGEREEMQGKEEKRRIDSKWRESDLEVNPFPIDSSRIKRINDRNQGRLTCITYHVYESPPLNYDLFIRLFGRKHTKQVEIQTRERNDNSCQSDVCSFREKSCQFPNYISNLETGGGRGEETGGGRGRGRGGRAEETGGREEDSTQSSFSWKDRGGLRSDPFKLRLFLLKAEQVINVSLERRFTSGRSQQQRSKSAKRLLNVPPSVQGFCTQFYKLIPPPFHTFSSLLSSSSSSHTRSSISSPSSSSSSKLGVQNMTYDSSYLISCQTSKHEGGEGGGGGGLREESFISLWSLKNTDKGAEYLFRTRTVVTCLASDHRTTIYAGSSDGSITLWDIRESTSSSSSTLLPSTLLSSTFQSVTEVNPVIKSVRGPSFTTACSSIPVTHSHPVTGLSLFKRNELSNCFPRLCSVDEEGLIILWMYQEDSTSTSFITSSSTSSSVPDLMDGMFPGSRIKLIQETFIRIPGNEFSIETMVTSSYDPFTFFLGTSLGQVIRVSKFSQDGEQKSPQIYFEQGEETFSAVTCIAFNPKMLTHFLVSFEDGTICFFSENKIQPLLTWDPSDLQISTVITVQWFPESGTSFAALASSSTILIWNLTSNLTNPSLKFQMTRYLTLSLSFFLSLPSNLLLTILLPEKFSLHRSLSLSLLTFLPLCTHFWY